MATAVTSLARIAPQRVWRLGPSTARHRIGHVWECPLKRNRFSTPPAGALSGGASEESALVERVLVGQREAAENITNERKLHDARLAREEAARSGAEGSGGSMECFWSRESSGEDTDTTRTSSASSSANLRLPVEAAPNRTSPAAGRLARSWRWLASGRRGALGGCSSHCSPSAPKGRSSSLDCLFSGRD